MLPKGTSLLVLEEVARLTMLPLFREANAMGIILDGDEQSKLKYLTIAMIALKILGKSTYET